MLIATHFSSAVAVLSVTFAPPGFHVPGASPARDERRAPVGSMERGMTAVAGLDFRIGTEQIGRKQGLQSRSGALRRVEFKSTKSGRRTAPN